MTGPGVMALHAYLQDDADRVRKILECMLPAELSAYRRQLRELARVVDKEIENAAAGTPLTTETEGQ